jgi:hypothetical protein
MCGTLCRQIWWAIELIIPAAYRAHRTWRSIGRE